MIDLDKLDKEIDELFERETSDSLNKWLIAKRFKGICKLIGNGTFVNMRSQKQPIFTSVVKAKFNQDSNSTSNNPINRNAA